MLLAETVHEGRGPTVEVGQVSLGFPRWTLRLADVLDACMSFFTLHLFQEGLCGE